MYKRQVTGLFRRGNQFMGQRIMVRHQTSNMMTQRDHAGTEMCIRDREEGVIEGRRTFANMLKYIKMTASSNFGNVFSVLVASAFLPFLAW